MATLYPDYQNEYFERLLECAICLERFNNPKLLPCQHTFCRGCLLKITDITKKCLRCPTCRYIYHLPASGVDGFPNNLTLKAFLDLPATLDGRNGRDDECTANISDGKSKPNHDMQIKCQQCEVGQGDGPCFHCNKTLCRVCRSSHRRMVFLDIKKQLVEINDYTKKVSDCLQAVRSTTELIRKTNEATKQWIGSTLDGFCRELQDRKNLLIHKLDFVQHNRLRSLTKQEEELKVKLIQLQSFYSCTASKIDEADAALSDQELIDFLRQCAQQLGRAEARQRVPLSSGIGHSKRRRSVTPKGRRQQRSRSSSRTKQKTDGNEQQIRNNPEPQHRDTAVALETDANPTTSSQLTQNSDYSQYRQENEISCRHAELNIDTDRHENETLLDNEITNAGNSGISHGMSETISEFPVQEVIPWSPTGEAAMETENSETTQHDNENNDDSTMTEIPSGIIIRAIIGKRGSRLWNPSAVSISPLHNNVVVVDSYKNCLQVLDRDGHFVTNFGTVGSANGQFDYPHSCFCTQEGNILVTDVFNHRVQIFSRFGQFLWKFGRLGTEDGELEAPSGVGVDRIGRIYVADTNNCRIQVFNEHGGHLKTFATPDTLPSDLQRPHYSFLVVSARGDVFVSDNKNHCIHKFDSSGHYLRCIGSHGNEIGLFTSPRGLALDRLGRLLAADRDNHRIQVFTEDGEFIYSFGSQGDRAGQFHRPEGIAVADNGDVAVAECGGQRIQLFSFADLIQ